MARLPGELWAATALNCAGLHAGDDAYRDLIAPERLEGLNLSDVMMGMWSCALTWLGIARVVGVIENNASINLPELDKAYEIGHAMQDCVSVLQKLGAWRQGGKPGLGDCVIVGPGGYHMRACIVAVNADGTVDVVEGGHITPDRKMSIELVKGLYLDEEYCGHKGASSSKIYGWGDTSVIKVNADSPPSVGGDLAV